MSGMNYHHRKLLKSHLRALPIPSGLNEGANIITADTLVDVIKSSAYQRIDPAFANTSVISDHEMIASHRIGDHVTVRFRAVVDGLRVIAADRVLSFNVPQGEWVAGRLTVFNVPSDRSFKLSAADALRISRTTALQGHLSASTHLRSENIDPTLIAERVYLADSWDPQSEETHLIPAYRVADPALPVNNRYIQFIHGATGAVIAKWTTVHRATSSSKSPVQSSSTVSSQSTSSLPPKQTTGYVFPVGAQLRFPGMPRPEASELIDVISPVTTNGGYGIRGKDFRGFSACQAYRCANGTGQNGTGSDLLGFCDEDGSICIPSVSMDYDTTDPDQKGVVPDNAYVVAWNFTMDGRFIDLDKDWVAAGFPNGSLILQWTDATVFAPIIKQPTDGSPWGSEVDFSSYTATEFNDTLSELQAYASLTRHLSFLRELIGDPSFCLIGQGPDCADIDPIANVSATPQTRQLRFVSNYIDLGSGDVLGQLDQGKGKSFEDPILLTGGSDFGNAFYSGSIFQPPLNGSEGYRNNCTDRDCLVIFDTPFAFIALGQTHESDWSLNECVVFHELTHGLVHKLIPDFPSHIWTNHGLQSDPGAMNEAWADYFAAIHCGIFDFHKTYNGQSPRSLVNDFDCTFCTGEVHHDGQIFSGALWAIRSMIPASDTATLREYDLLILHALALGHATDTFETQFTIIHDLISIHQNPAISQLSSAALKEFEWRDLNCSRSTFYNESMDATFVLDSASTTSANLSTMPNQLIITPKKSDWGFQISWKQWYISPILGPLSIGYGKSLLPFLISQNCPLSLKTASSANHSGVGISNITGFRECDSSVVQWQYTSLGKVGPTHGSLTTTFTPGSADAVYVWIAHTVPATITLFSTYLTLWGWTRVFYLTFAAVGCGIGGIGLMWIFLGIPGWAVYAHSRAFSAKKSHGTEKASPETADIEWTATHGPESNTDTVRASSSADIHNGENGADLTNSVRPREKAVKTVEKDANAISPPRISPRLLTLHCLLASLFHVGAGVAAIIGIVYNPVRYITTYWASVGMIIVNVVDLCFCLVCVIILKPDGVLRQKHESPTEKRQGLLNYLQRVWYEAKPASCFALSATWCLFWTALSLYPNCVSGNVSAGAHGFIYLMFLFGILGRILCYGWVWVTVGRAVILRSRLLRSLKQ